MRPRTYIPIILTGVLAVGGCASTPSVELRLPEKHSLVREQLVFHSDFPLAAQHRLLEDLTARRYDLSRQLALPLSDEPIHVYLFNSPARFQAFMRLHHREFPQRRAFFIETDTRLTVYAHWGDRVAEDLRHEVTHAYLHAVVPNLPLWLDEGLAEYFEVPRGHRGTNRPHLDLLLARLNQGRWQPDIHRVEQFDAALEMTQDDYAESWAWVHLLLNSRPERRQLIQRYLGDLRRDGSAEPLPIQLSRMLAGPERALTEHVRHLAAAVRQ